MSKRSSDELIGMVAGMLTTGSFIPQAIKAWCIRPTPAYAVSFWSIAAMSLGICFWLWYGKRIRSASVIFWNIVALPFAFAVLIYKILYG